MSAQSYTNRRRVLAEASLLKTEYPGNVGYRNFLTATIDCEQTFENTFYKDICGCSFTNRGRGKYPPYIPPYIPPQPPPRIEVLSGGNSTTNSFLILSGGYADTDSDTIFSGGQPPIVIVISEITGGDSNTNSLLIFSGGTSHTESLQIFSGGS
jgi:hypothetical protein